MISEKIDIFLDAGRELNFSAVARKNYTTQPTVSRLIAELEAEWGMKLFIRSNKGLRLTPEGAVMLDCCKKMERLITEALDKSGKMGSGKNERLRLGFLTETDVEQRFGEAIPHLSEQYPKLELTFVYGSFGDLRKSLQKDMLDIVFTYDFEIPNYGDDVVIDHIMKLNPCLVLAPAHPLYKTKPLNIWDLSEEIFYLPEESDSPGREKDMMYILRNNHLEKANIRFTPNVDSALLQARLGRGIALVNYGVPQIRQYQLRTLLLEGADTYCRLNLVGIWKKDNLNPFIARFMEMVRSQEIQ